MQNNTKDVENTPQDPVDIESQDLVDTEIQASGSVGNRVSGDTAIDTYYTITYSSSSSDVGQSPFISLTTPVQNVLPDTTNSSPDGVDYVSKRGVSVRFVRYILTFCGCVNISQMIVLLLVPFENTLPVTITRVFDDDGVATFKTVELFHISIKIAMAVIFATTGFFNLLAAAPYFHRWYALGVVDKCNYFRWMEYSVTSSLMSILIAGFIGINDMTALGGIFTLQMGVSLLVWLQERYEFPGTGGMLPMMFAWLVGIFAWLIMLPYVIPYGLQEVSQYSIPAYASTFITFMLYGMLKTLQYANVWIFADFLVGELLFMFLDIFVNTFFTWYSYSILK
jgi:hypothetical protein